FGRKPILMISIFGLCASYILWIFAGSFTLLIIARFIGGIMGGNLSVATAVVADVTNESNRSKGMAFVGIAFAFGFIFGPALGGFLTLYNPMDSFPELVKFGLNPFSYAALLAGILSLVNLIILFFKFEETLDIKKQKVQHRSSNIIKLFTPLKDRNINYVNYVYFLFILAFSGMEFNLTFLAVERFNYSSMQNAYMFIFIGFIIAIVQGGFIRRRAHDIGEKKVALIGMSIIIPGLFTIAYASSEFTLYLGLFFLSVGSACAIPTLTALVSLLTSQSEQGRSLGIFRALGSLGRVFGPIMASVLYWKMGSTIPYVLGGVSIILPLLILIRVDDQP
ncbi:MAG: MFS transporter, partial [Halobacteriovoraceae bacterium]|nr:MFS transporter [Halobacteriovoraceae bacterium]